MTSDGIVPQDAPPGVQEMFAVALGHHKAGRLNDAERLYRQVLQADSRAEPVLILDNFLLGVIIVESQHQAIHRFGLQHQSALDALVVRRGA